LVDADACWHLGGDHRVRSGPWFETGPQGATSHLEATALTAAGESILLLQRLGSDFLDRHLLVQTAREKVLAHQRVQLEMQKKEILLHCLAEDLTAGLSNITLALQLIELEERPTQVRHLLNLAAVATREQQSLIHRVLSHFTAEVDGLYGSAEGTAGMGTDLGEAWQRALALVSPEFAEHGVSLSSPETPLAGVRVLAPAGSLERVLASLLENARQNTPPGETVRIQCEVRSNAVEVRVEDPGEWRPAELNERPFARSDHAPAPLSPTALRLQFCRIVIENCQGGIECRPGSGGGNCFWFRLPRTGPTG
jgi:K+-sensing histidine kinase KdpD